MSIRSVFRGRHRPNGPGRVIPPLPKKRKKKSRTTACRPSDEQDLSRMDRPTVQGLMAVTYTQIQSHALDVLPRGKPERASYAPIHVSIGMPSVLTILEAPRGAVAAEILPHPVIGDCSPPNPDC